MILQEQGPRRAWASIFLTVTDLKRVSVRIRVRVRVKLGLGLGGTRASTNVT